MPRGVWRFALVLPAVAARAVLAFRFLRGALLRTSAARAPLNNYLCPRKRGPCVYTFIAFLARAATRSAPLRSSVVRSMQFACV